MAEVKAMFLRFAPTVTVYDTTTGASGNCTVASGAVTATVANIGDGSFRVSGTSTANTVRQLSFHYRAVSRV